MTDKEFTAAIKKAEALQARLDKRCDSLATQVGALRQKITDTECVLKDKRVKLKTLQALYKQSEKDYKRADRDLKKLLSSKGGTKKKK